MPPIDLAQAVKAAIEKNREIPAMLDAYGQFIDAPIGPLELQNLDLFFMHVLDNLSQRFPDIASRRAASNARNDVSSFLVLANNNVDRVKTALKKELVQVNKTMTASIAERFSRLDSDEKKAIDATLRLIRRTTVDLLFSVESGKQLSTAGKEYEKFFSAVRSEAPSIRELRYENLIVEKAIFNKLILKSKTGDYTIWVPSYFAKENVDALISMLALPTEHILLSNLKELESSGKLNSLRPFLNSLVENLGVLPKDAKIPEVFSDYFSGTPSFQVMPPVELDDVILFLKQEEEKAESERRRTEEAKLRVEAEAREKEERKVEESRLRKRPTVIETVVPSGAPLARVFIGKQLDFEQLVSAINRRASEKEMQSQLKTIGEYYLPYAKIREKGLTIVGSSGSGRSTTLKRVLDGLALLEPSRRIILIDQKGEHRGIAWKHAWSVYAFQPDAQAKELRVNPLGESGEAAELTADLIQEWCLQAGLACSDQQRARIASLIRALGSSLTLESLVSTISKEADLATLGQKLSRNLVPKSSTARMFGPETPLSGESTIFDISGRGLRDPTTKEERQIISVLLLKRLVVSGQRDSLIVLEDLLDRFKSNSLRRQALEMISKLKANGCSIIATSRSQVKDFVGMDCIDLVHRLSGEKVVNDVLSGFDSNIQTKILTGLLIFLPRGYLIASRISEGDSTTPSAAVRVEPLQFAQV